MRRGNFSKVYKGELVEVKLEKQMKDNPIIIDELSILNDSILKKKKNNDENQDTRKNENWG